MLTKLIKNSVRYVRTNNKLSFNSKYASNAEGNLIVETVVVFVRFPQQRSILESWYIQEDS